MGTYFIGKINSRTQSVKISENLFSTYGVTLNIVETYIAYEFPKQHSTKQEIREEIIKKRSGYSYYALFRRSARTALVLRESNRTPTPRPKHISAHVPETIVGTREVRNDNAETKITIRTRLPYKLTKVSAVAVCIISTSTKTMIIIPR